MNRAASRISARSPKVSGCIEKLAGLVDRLEKILLAYSPGEDESDLAPEQVRQCLLKCEKSCCPRSKIIVSWIFDQEIDVATFRIKIWCTDRAEDLQPRNAKFPAEGTDGLQMLGDDRGTSSVSKRLHQPLRSAA